MEVTRQSFFHWTRINIARQVFPMSQHTFDATSSSSLSMRLRGGGKRSCGRLPFLRYLDVSSDTGEFGEYLCFCTSVFKSV